MIVQFELFNVESIELSSEEPEVLAMVSRRIPDEYAASVTDGPMLLKKIQDALAEFRK